MVDISAEDPVDKDFHIGEECAKEKKRPDKWCKFCFTDLFIDFCRNPDENQVCKWKAHSIGCYDVNFKSF